MTKPVRMVYGKKEARGPSSAPIIHKYFTCAFLGVTPSVVKTEIRISLPRAFLLSC